MSLALQIMLAALLTDIHANREALAACLSHARDAGAERYVFLGDYVGYGADPRWVLETVMAHVERGAVAILGNHDAAAIGVPQPMNELAASAIAWTRRELDDRHREFLAALPLTFEDDDRLFVHGSAQEPRRFFYVTDALRAEGSFAATPARRTFCGHTHVPLLFHLSVTGKLGVFEPVAGVSIPLTPQRRWLAVIGSVGQPRDDNPAACYALLDDRTGLLTYVRVAYDVDAAARKIRAAGLPELLAARLLWGR